MSNTPGPASSDFISICMPAYNGSRYIESQILSIIKSCNLWGDDWELLICDDSSNDHTLEILTRFSDPRIKVFFNAKNLGVVQTVNRLLHSAAGNIIILSDQDDIWLENRVSDTAKVFRENRCSALLCGNLLINSKSELLSMQYPPKIFGKTRTDLLSNLIRNQYLGCCMALDRCILMKVLPIPQYATMHDVWIGIVAALSAGVFYYNKPLVYYRRHSSNFTGLTSASVFHALYYRLMFIVMVLAALVRSYR